MTATDRDPATIAREVLDIAHEDETVTVCSVPDNKAAALARAVIDLTAKVERVEALAKGLDHEADMIEAEGSDGVEAYVVDAHRLVRFAAREGMGDAAVEALFEAYTAMMDDLSASYPTVTFLHVTVTPTRWQPENNAKIEEFNELVRQEYADRGRLVDLAGALSRCPDGTVDRHETEEGDSYSQICEAFTRDGGHLSPEGAATAAAELLSVVAANLVDR